MQETLPKQIWNLNFKFEFFPPHDKLWIVLWKLTEQHFFFIYKFRVLLEQHSAFLTTDENKIKKGTYFCLIFSLARDEGGTYIICTSLTNSWKWVVVCKGWKIIMQPYIISRESRVLQKEIFQEISIWRAVGDTNVARHHVLFCFISRGILTRSNTQSYCA